MRSSNLTEKGRKHNRIDMCHIIKYCLFLCVLNSPDLMTKYFSVGHSPLENLMKAMGPHRGGNLLFAKGDLDIYNIILRPHKTINFTISLLYMVRHLINSSTLTKPMICACTTDR